jgi:oxygen-independent coproporphyrinogen-3 oxidase
MMALRLTEGADLARFRALGGSELDTKPLESNGFLFRSGDRLRTAPAGRLLLNSVLRDLLA